MKITETTDRPSPLIEQLVTVWEDSVKATHRFLSAVEITAIKGYIPQALAEVSHLITAEDDTGMPAGFMGIEGRKLEMLFLSPEVRGRGLGKRLVQYGIQNYGVREVCVNEQNPQARGFYEHMGFQVYKRTDLDEQGGPYPILYMRLTEKT